MIIIFAYLLFCATTSVMRKGYPMSAWCRWGGHQFDRQVSNYYSLLMYFHDVYIFIYIWIYWPWEPWKSCKKFLTIDACAWAWKWIYGMYNDHDMEMGWMGKLVNCVLLTHFHSLYLLYLGYPCPWFYLPMHHIYILVELCGSPCFTLMSF